MATMIPSVALVPAGYSGLTRQAYELDLRQYASWCSQHQLCLFAARRRTSSASPATWRPAADPGLLLPAGCARVAGFYRYA
jgi:hypothetical protein